jgi:hypothetical protein
MSSARPIRRPARRRWRADAVARDELGQQHHPASRRAVAQLREQQLGAYPAKRPRVAPHDRDWRVHQACKGDVVAGHERGVVRDPQAAVAHLLEGAGGQLIAARDDRSRGARVVEHRGNSCSPVLLVELPLANDQIGSEVAVAMDLLDASQALGRA